MEYRTQMLDEMQEDHFIVWDTSRDDKATLWGGVMTATAKGKTESSLYRWRNTGYTSDFEC